MKAKIKTIDIQAKEWFDRINGNSYFSGTITTNYGMKSAKTFEMPFQYGYGSQYEQEALSILEKEGLIKSRYTADLRDAGIILRSSIKRNCKKRELL